MTPIQMLIAVSVSYLLAVAGATWQFGPYGLYASGGLALVALSFVDVEKKGGEDGDG